MLEFLNVVEEAAIAADDWTGRGDKNAADQAAVDAMRTAFNDIGFSGRIVIGEGERDEAPMLYIGEEVGRGGEEIDIAVDPLEGTNLCARAQSNALSTIAVAPRGALLHAPDTYMDKLAAGPECVGLVHIDKSPAENVQAVASALGKDVKDVVVCILDRERHKDLIAAVYASGARVRLIPDGDVYGALASAVPGTGIDLYLGIGAAPEGVLAATAMRCIGGVFMGRFAFRSDEERARAAATSEIEDLDGVLTIDDLVRSDEAIFIATGVTDGEMVSGVKRAPGAITTESIVMDNLSKTVRTVKTTRRTASGRITF